MVVSYLIFPETEGVTLEEIELHFSNDKLGLFDRVIAKKSDESKTDDSPLKSK